MSRRPATFTQTEVARAIRAAKQAGAECVEVRPDGTIVVLLKSVPVVPVVADDPFTQWERQYESEKAAGRSERHQAARRRNAAPLLLCLARRPALEG
jgi:hypothetical protein